MPRPDPFDPDRLRLPPAAPADRPAGPAAKPPRHRAGEPFLKGPIPWTWLAAAAGLPGKALAVGLVVWREAGCRGVRTVPLRLGAVARLGMHPDTAKRGLRALERAGLVAVRRRPGRCPDVTIREADLDAPGVVAGVGSNGTPQATTGGAATGRARTAAG
jgi:hypothetical protein